MVFDLGEEIEWYDQVLDAEPTIQYKQNKIF